MPIKQYSDGELDAMVSGFAFPEYPELVECREIVDDCLAGQKTVKEKGKYLPANKWQREHPQAYREFLFRALFPSETKYSLDIYEGLFHLGNPTVTLPKDGKMDYLIDDASVTRDGLKQIQVRLNKEQMSHGLRVMLLEVRDNTEKPFFIQEYSANKFLRAHFTDSIVSGESIADMVLLNESTVEYDLQSWSYRKIFRILLLALDANNQYYQRIVSPEDLAKINVKIPPNDKSTIYPTYQKKRFDRIPVIWCGSSGLSGASMEYPPLLPMAQTELKMFLCMAHHSQHIYMSTQETIVATGMPSNVKVKDDEFTGGAFVSLPGKDTKVQYLATNGVGFTAEEAEIARLQSSIEEKRLSLMNAKSHQSGTVVGLVQNSMSAPLRTVVNVSGNALTSILRYAARWMGYKEAEIKEVNYVPSQEFANPRVNLSEFIALCKAVVLGDVVMLEEDLYNMARESGFINSKLTWAQFKAKYDVEWEKRQRKTQILVKDKGNPIPADSQNAE